jgi:phosphate transport system protein
MPRNAYHRALQDLHDQVLLLGSEVDEAVGKAMGSLACRDLAGAREVIEADRAVNRRRYEIEEQAIRLLATQQPMASDLRAIISVLNVVVELERIGDYAVGIAKITLLHTDKPLLKPLLDLPRMATKGRDMLRGALAAFATGDVEAARAIAGDDDEVDALYDQVYRELLTYMIGDPQTIDRATWLLWVAHDLERIADRVTNICERVIYKATGELVEINVSTY